MWQVIDYICAVTAPCLVGAHTATWGPKFCLQVELRVPTQF